MLVYDVQRLLIETQNAEDTSYLRSLWIRHCLRALIVFEKPCYFGLDPVFCLFHSALVKEKTVNRRRIPNPRLHDFTLNLPRELNEHATWFIISFAWPLEEKNEEFAGVSIAILLVCEFGYHGFDIHWSAHREQNGPKH
ncbi:hypothetical protein ACTXT7_004773 [Hymenolepis weldensis]